MNSKIALSGLSILSALALMAGGTFAFFSDTNSSTANTFTTGTLELQLDDVDEEVTSNTISGSIGGANMFPGSSVNGFISVHNSGSLPMSKVVFGANQTSNEDNGDGSNLADVLDLTVETGDNETCESNNVNQTGQIATEVGDGFSPLTLSELNAADYDALPGLAAGGTYYVCITATMQSGAGNTYQGDNTVEDFVFTGNQ